MRPWQGASLVLVCLLSLAACGQKGPLRLPNDPKAADRATILESLLPASDGVAKRPAASPAVPTAPAATDPQKTSPAP